MYIHTLYKHCPITFSIFSTFILFLKYLYGLCFPPKLCQDSESDCWYGGCHFFLSFIKFIHHLPHYVKLNIFTLIWTLHILYILSAVSKSPYHYIKLFLFNTLNSIRKNTDYPHSPLYFFHNGYSMFVCFIF